MENLYNELLKYLKEENKEKALKLSIDSLEQGVVSVLELYTELLGPALNSIIDEYKEDDNLIWREHVRSGIIRTIIESAYPYVIKERNEKRNKDLGKVIVMCPRYEDHEIGARMATDIFTIAGYDTTYIGSNTPEETMIKAVEAIKPKYISMSITNYYNLVAARKTIELIKSKFDYGVKFILGGYAFESKPEYYKDIGGDMLLKDFEEIFYLGKGDDIQ